MSDDDATPVLRADATDDDLQTEDIQSSPSPGKPAKAGRVEVPIKVEKWVCPICGLEGCFHNLPYVLETETIT